MFGTNPERNVTRNNKKMIITRSIDTTAYCTNCSNFISKDNDIRYPLVLNWLITSSCDFRCKYCFATDIRNVDSIDTHITKYVNESQYLKIVISGGEPFNNKNIWEVIKNIRNKHKAITIDTNGVYRFNLQQYRIIKEKNITIRVSLDSTNPTENEKIRPAAGGNYYENVIENIQSLLRKGINVELQTVVTKHNIKSLENISVLVEYWKIKKWYLQPLIPSGRATKMPGIVPTLKSIKNECKRLQLDYNRFIIKEDDNKRAVILLNNFGDVITEYNNNKITIGNIDTMDDKKLLKSIDMANHIKRYKTIVSCSCQ